MTRKERQLARLQKEVRKECEEKQTRLARKLIQQHFKIQNSFSALKKEKWWLYVAVVDAKDGECVCVQHEVDSNGDVRIRQTSRNPRYFEPPSEYKPITPGEYYSAFNAAIRRAICLRESTYPKIR